MGGSCSTSNQGSSWCGYSFAKGDKFVSQPNANILLYNYMQIFMRMGLPKLLTSDQGGEFRSDLDKEMMSLLGIKRHLVTPYHPQVH